MSTTNNFYMGNYLPAANKNEAKHEMNLPLIELSALCFISICFRLTNTIAKNVKIITTKIEHNRAINQGCVRKSSIWLWFMGNLRMRKKKNLWFMIFFVPFLCFQTMFVFDIKKKQQKFWIISPDGRRRSVVATTVFWYDEHTLCHLRRLLQCYHECFVWYYTKRRHCRNNNKKKIDAWY